MRGEGLRWFGVFEGEFGAEESGLGFQDKRCWFGVLQYFRSHFRRGLSVYVEMRVASGSYSESPHALGCSMKKPLGKQAHDQHLLLEAM